MLEIKMLGQFSISISGEPILISSRPAQSLLSYLILNAGKSHRRERLAGLIWQDATEKNSRQYLRNTLWRIRKEIGTEKLTGEEYILADKISVTLNPKCKYWSDVGELEREHINDRSTNDLISTLSLYDGELLPGFNEDWVILERARINAIYEHKIQSLIDCLVQESRWEDVFDWGEKWIALGQVPEPAYRALMLAHMANGDTSGMVAV